MDFSNYSNNKVSEFIITGFDHLSHQKVLGSVVFVTYVLILVFCTANISFILLDRHLHFPMYILICNLAFIDMMFSSSAGITMISVLLLEIKTISYISCATTVFFYHLGDIILCLAITLMALDRMLAIAVPLRYHSILTNRRCIILIVLTWLLSITAMGFVTRLADTLPYCQPKIGYVFCDYAGMVRASCVSPEPYFILPVFFAIWLLGVHFTLIFMSYVVIIITVLRLPDIGYRKVFSTCTAHVIVCTSFYAPKLISVLLSRIGVRLNLTQRNAVIIVASMLPPLINPVTYCFTTKELRVRMIKLLTYNRVAVK